jgi:negative regulator of flagellin synthesis FlgM
MKINDVGLTQQFPLGKGEPKSGKSNAEKGSSVASSSVSSASVVSLSSASQVASTASTSSVQDSGPFDAHKVEQIKSAIASGQFQVNAGNIADSLIASVHGLLAGTGG